MRTIYIMSGIPGSGKSTWMHKNAQVGDLMVSRDNFRASLRNELGKPNDYFPLPANQEWARWTMHLKECIERHPQDIYIDQTTLTQGALNKLLDAIQSSLRTYDNIVVVSVRTSLKTCLERNALREGHERVPDDVIRSMHDSMFKHGIDTNITREKYPNNNFDVTYVTDMEG